MDDKWKKVKVKIEGLPIEHMGELVLEFSNGRRSLTIGPNMTLESLLLQSGGKIYIGDKEHYLYRSGNDIYRYDGSTGTQIN